MTRRLQMSAILLLFAMGASARESDDTLGLLQAPHEGNPALVTKKGAFSLLLRAKAEEVRLERDGASIVLATDWKEAAGLWHGQCQVPEETPEGAYAVAATAGGQTDRNVRSVFVYTSFPEHYRFAQLTDIHVGNDRKWGPGADIFRKAIETVNASDAAFVILTGDLTHSSDPDQYHQFLDILNTCTLPTFVTPGNHDREHGQYERVFGNPTYTFNFNDDAYLSYDTKDMVTANEYGAQDADLELLRRAMRPARWSIGFTHRYEPSIGMRSQLVLFVDGPLDYLIFGHVHRANNEDEKVVPWGATPFTTTPATIDGYWRMFDISANAIKPEPPQKFMPTP